MGRIEEYMQRVEGVTGYRRNLGRVGKLTGDSHELLGSHALAEYARSASKPEIEWGIGTAAGLVAGGIIGHKHGHWLLGALSGSSVFTNAPALLKSTTRSEALWNLLQTHGGVFASLAVKKDASAITKALAFVLGNLGVGIVREFYGKSR